MLGALATMMGRRARCSSSQSPGQSLLDVWRVLPYVNHPTLPTGPRTKFFPAAVRDMANVPVTPVRHSVWQPVNIPTAVQYDFNPEYALIGRWRFDGTTFARLPQPYAPDPRQVGQMNQKLSPIGFVVQTNQYNTLPWILAVGQQQRNGG